MDSQLATIRRKNVRTPSSVARSIYENFLHARSRERNPSELKRPAIVFAPHQDDETLGCGGTIALKLRVGAPVRIVFMTDGSRSHSRGISAQQLARVRHDEACKAAETLGLTEKHLTFLDFEDGNLKDHFEEARTRVAELLTTETPEEVFVPYRLDVHPDHLATRRIVLSAARKQVPGLYVSEYGVWFWRQWPWVGLGGSLKETMDVARTTLNSRLGTRLFSAFRSSVRIAEVANLKRAALECHRSQMARLVPDVKWPTLRDVSRGEFIECFFRDHEFFHEYQMVP